MAHIVSHTLPKMSLLPVLLLSMLFLVSGNAERIHGALFETELDRNECISGQPFTDISGSEYMQGLNTVLSSVKCLSSNGVSANLSESGIIPIISSAKISTDLLQSTPSMTFDMWLQFPNVTIDRNKLIMSVGKDQFSSLLGTADFAFELFQRPLRSADQIALALVVTSSTTILTLPFADSAPVHIVQDVSQVIHIALVMYYYEIIDPRKNNPLQYFVCDLLINGQFIDYVSAVSDTSTFRPSAWPSNYYQLNFFNTYYMVDLAVWEGSLRYFAWYNQSLTDAEVGMNFAAGLPNNAPVALSTQASVQQNGEVGNHDSNPAYYNRMISSTALPILTLDGVDFEDSMQWTTQGYLPAALTPAESATHSYMFMLITSYPTKGALYYLNGTLISQSRLPVVIRREFVPNDNTASGGTNMGTEIGPASTEGSTVLGRYVYGVRYRPRENQYSGEEIYTNFTYTAVDGVTGIGSIETAVMEILVTAVNQPPRPRYNLTVVVMAGTLIDIDLVGVDIDSSISYATVISIPTQGDLFDAAASVLSPGATVPTINVGQISQRIVQYRYNGPGNSPDPVTGFIATDAFNYTVTDSSGFESVVGTITVYITSAVVVQNGEGAVTVLESPYVNVLSIYGHDFNQQSQQDGRVLRVQITQLPTHGQLYQYPVSYSGSEAIDVTTLVPVTTVGELSVSRSNASNSPILLLYIGALYYFSSPSTNWQAAVIPATERNTTVTNNTTTVDTVAIPAPDDGFAYRLVATASTNTADPPILATSTLHSFDIRVRNVNTPMELALVPDPSLIYLPRVDHKGNGENVLTVHAVTVSAKSGTGTSATSTSTSTATVTDPVDGTPPTSLFLAAFTVIDHDRGADPIRVEITTNHGFITLNRAHLAVLDFNSFAYCDLSSCEGDGTGDKVSKFVTSSAGLQQVLSGLKYESTTPNVMDELRITIYDGVSNPTATATSSVFAHTLPTTAISADTSPQGTGCLTATELANSLSDATTLRTHCYNTTLVLPIQVLGLLDTNGGASTAAAMVSSLGNTVMLYLSGRSDSNVSTAVQVQNTGAAYAILLVVLVAVYKLGCCCKDSCMSRCPLDKGKKKNKSRRQTKQATIIRETIPALATKSPVPATTNAKADVSNQPHSPVKKKQPRQQQTRIPVKRITIDLRSMDRDKHRSGTTSKHQMTNIFGNNKDKHQSHSLPSSHGDIESQPSQPAISSRGIDCSSGQKSTSPRKPHSPGVTGKRTYWQNILRRVKYCCGCLFVPFKILLYFVAGVHWIYQQCGAPTTPDDGGDAEENTEAEDVCHDRALEEKAAKPTPIIMTRGVESRNQLTKSRLQKKKFHLPTTSAHSISSPVSPVSPSVDKSHKPPTTEKSKNKKKGKGLRSEESVTVPPVSHEPSDGRSKGSRTFVQSARYPDVSAAQIHRRTGVQIASKDEQDINSENEEREPGFNPKGTGSTQASAVPGDSSEQDSDTDSNPEEVVSKPQRHRMDHIMNNPVCQQTEQRGRPKDQEPRQRQRQRQRQAEIDVERADPFAKLHASRVKAKTVREQDKYKETKETAAHYQSTERSTLKPKSRWSESESESEPEPELPPPPPPDQFKQYTHQPTGRRYYLNLATRKTTWQRPPAELIINMVEAPASIASDHSHQNRKGNSSSYSNDRVMTDGSDCATQL